MGAGNLEMTVADVVEFSHLMQTNQIGFYVDGGWAVDALLGRQTRPHLDLDIAVQHKDVTNIRALLEAKSYHDIPVDDSWECNFVLGDGAGHHIDIHSCTFDENGKNIFGVAYPLESLSGEDEIGGEAVKCISPTWLVRFHTGYQVDENDFRDVKALCAAFNLPIPADFVKFLA
jgi:lincosamide nucleotidyltransferase A/C/D/E